MRGVLLSGGHGTRLSPFTKTVTNKHLAPVYSKDGAVPMITYPLSTLINIGITEILIISSQEHCGDIVEYLGDGEKFGVELTYKIQDMNDPERPVGIASALKLAESFTGGENFVVILGDNYYDCNISFSDTITFWNNHCSNKCGVFLSYTEEWERFGVGVFDDETEKLLGVVEKPSEFYSKWAITGMYYYTPDVYKYLSGLKPSDRGELEISDINDMYIKKNECDYVKFSTFWSDMGTVESMIKTQEFINGK